MFRAAYDSAWQHPGIAFIAGAMLVSFGALALVLSRRSHDMDPRRRAWLTSFFVLELVVLLDAFFTGAWSPLRANSAVANAVAICFVIAGDLRFFYLVERQRGEVATGLRTVGRALAVALPVSLIMPIATAIANVVSPERYQGNFLYLVYELAFVVLAAAFALLRMPRASDGADRRRKYVARLLVLELTQYGLWALADALIVSGRDYGYLVRMFPNAIYYAAFVPIATLATPAGSRT